MIDLKEPKYNQIKRELMEELTTGKFTVGAAFYTEPELEARFGVSRGTVRTALRDLQEAGFLIRQSGRGTVVARLPRNRGISKQREIVPLSQLIDGAKLASSTKVIRQEIIPAGGAEGRVLEGFKILPHQSVVCISRLRLGNGVPLALQTVYLRPQDCPDLLTEELSHSWIGLYAKKYGRQLDIADEILHVAPANEENASLLELPPETLVVIRDRISYDQQNRPFEVLHSVDRVGACEYHHEIHREQSEIVIAG